MHSFYQKPFYKTIHGIIKYILLLRSHTHDHVLRPISRALRTVPLGQDETVCNL